MQSLDDIARKAFSLFRSRPENTAELSRDVAYHVGAQAKRLGYTKNELGSWIQSAYSGVFVRETRLNPGLDLKEIRDILFKAYDRTKSASIENVISKYAESLVTPEYVMGVAEGIDIANAPDAFRLLQSLARSLRNESVIPFPISALEAYLQERGVSEDEIALVQAVKIKPVRNKKEFDFADSLIQFGHVTGTNVIADMRFEGDPDAGKNVTSWLLGFKKLKPKAKRIWDRSVKKVNLGRPTALMVYTHSCRITNSNVLPVT